MNYIYDGTFDGFLTCVYEHYHSAKADGIFARGVYQADMLTPPREVRTDEGKARTVEAAIVKKISPHALARVYRVFRTDTDGKELMLLSYIRLCFKSGPAMAFLHSHPLVNPVEKAELKIGNEVHRLCGLIRFSAVCPAPAGGAGHGGEGHGGTVDSGAEAVAAQMREILYARVEPDHEVLEFLAPHFTDRFKSEPFIIHDTRRGRALVAWHRRWHIEDFTERDAALLENAPSERGYRDMWRRYFDAIAIKERKNPRCQRNFMPARYWQNLTEMQPR
ncbi:MAG: TIGR03915 family putative DNA repair protein [Clostridiales Family XIII bacterium]|jgi:probable DNA metabolism protein|nr:TIGR03915 family putative DNA repair protein [Clostridiales Family XIII bacterium]